jgi:hypothetical protein
VLFRRGFGGAVGHEFLELFDGSFQFVLEHIRNEIGGLGL